MGRRLLTVIEVVAFVALPFATFAAADAGGWVRVTVAAVITVAGLLMLRHELRWDTVDHRCR